MGQNPSVKVKVFEMNRSFILSSCGLLLMFSECVLAVRNPKESKLELIPGSRAGIMDPCGVSINPYWYLEDAPKKKQFKRKCMSPEKREIMSDSESDSSDRPIMPKRRKRCKKASNVLFVKKYFKKKLRAKERSSKKSAAEHTESKAQNNIETDDKIMDEAYEVANAMAWEFHREMLQNARQMPGQRLQIMKAER